MMNAIGLVFLYDRNIGNPNDISTKFSSHFANVGENLVLEGLLELPTLKEIMDMKRIYWGGVKENFLELLDDDDAIGKLAWKVFVDNSKIEPSEQVKSLIYEKQNAPWDFSLMVCVLYE
jgi:hypothetical protein